MLERQGHKNPAQAARDNIVAWIKKDESGLRLADIERKADQIVADYYGRASNGNDGSFN